MDEWPHRRWHARIIPRGELAARGGHRAGRSSAPWRMSAQGYEVRVGYSSEDVLYTRLLSHLEAARHFAGGARDCAAKTRLRDGSAGMLTPAKVPRIRRSFDRFPGHPRPVKDGGGSLSATAALGVERPAADTCARSQLEAMTQAGSAFALRCLSS